MVPIPANSAAPPEAEWALGTSPPPAGIISPAQVIRNHQAILGFTAEIFPGAAVAVEEAIDPEIEGEAYLVILVTTSGEVAELVAKHREWHRKLRMLAPETARSYRLLLDVQ